MAQKCDDKYFQLAFLLNENLIAKFKVEFKNFISMHKKYFGEYWTTAIKLNSQLLYIKADNQELVDVREFILIELEDPDMKKPITITFEKVAKFQTIFNEQLQECDETIYVKL